MRYRMFEQALADGQRAEAEWVREQQSLGLAVSNTAKITGSFDRCQSPDAVGLIRIEIKTRDLRFTGPEDYPFSTAFLANVAQADQDLSDPLIYVLISRPTKCWVWAIATDRNEEWRVREVTDTTRGTPFVALECPKSHLRFSDTLPQVFISHGLLQYIDADTSGFVGQDQKVGADNCGIKGRDGEAKSPSRKHLG